ncbi:uncharacterized protein LOC130127183 [Lampris incognitus]|uniref:uncharacterized protein LOC130127183 n=1 Tax=Lampris incognitus TaxID=2546036 RepID=UPI0024B4E7CE|nr:uncharacterized protein LOC130127183 [Lampris incognitus]
MGAQTKDAPSFRQGAAEEELQKSKRLSKSPLRWSSSVDYHFYCKSKTRMKTIPALLVLLMPLCTALRQGRPQSPEWDLRAETAEKVNTRGCANLTLVLDNWKYAIMTQVKDLLLHDHGTVLPDYGRIQPLSDALGDLYKEFNVLKERLGELTSKFEGVEAFVDDVGAGRPPSLPRAEPRPPGLLAGEENATPTEEGGRSQGRRNRIVVRRVKKPAGS